MSATDTPGMPATHRYSVPDISCGHCVAAIETEVRKIEGVTSVHVDLDAKLVTVDAPPNLDASIRQAIDDAGYDIT